MPAPLTTPCRADHLQMLVEGLGSKPRKLAAAPPLRCARQRPSSLAAGPCRRRSRTCHWRAHCSPSGCRRCTAAGSAASCPGPAPAAAPARVTPPVNATIWTQRSSREHLVMQEAMCPAVVQQQSMHEFVVAGKFVPTAAASHQNARTRGVRVALSRRSRGTARTGSGAPTWCRCRCKCCT